jgi:hypothetical protein
VHLVGSKCKGKIILIFILIFTYFDNKQEEKYSKPNFSIRSVVSVCSIFLHAFDFRFSFATLYKDLLLIFVL